MTVATLNMESVVVYILGNGEVFVETLSSFSEKELTKFVRINSLLNHKRTQTSLNAEVWNNKTVSK